MVEKEVQVLVIGGGPAGLTAGLELVRSHVHPTIWEAESELGGISKTVSRDEWKFDLGGHRFFTKVKRVDDFWHTILSDEDFMMRPRMSRIFFRGKFYDYPLKAANALSNLGVLEALLCVLSYVFVRINPPKDQSSFEGWVASRFGWRLYRNFFKTYTEKVWGMPATEIQADWAAQRIKNLSLFKAILNAVIPRKRNSTEVTSLIDRFKYPKLGPGMMWERCGEMIVAGGGTVKLNTKVVTLSRTQIENGKVETVLVAQSKDGEIRHCDYVISTMPLNELIYTLNPPAPSEVMQAANGLKHRDFLTVALVVPESAAFPDNWIYIHDPHVKVGRIQNFGSWSPYMVKPGFTCLGLEYFVNSNDEVWNMNDEDLIELAKDEMKSLNLVDAEVIAGYVVRVPKAYPVYDSKYSQNVLKIREFLDESWPSILTVGRNGMHRYNNQDHSMLTAMLCVENILKNSCHNLWNVNVEGEYHEEIASESPRGTGRAAPTFK